MIVSFYRNPEHFLFNLHRNLEIMQYSYRIQMLQTYLDSPKQMLQLRMLVYSFAIQCLLRFN